MSDSLPIVAAAAPAETWKTLTDQRSFLPPGLPNYPETDAMVIAGTAMGNFRKKVKVALRKVQSVMPSLQLALKTVRY